MVTRGMCKNWLDLIFCTAEEVCNKFWKTTVCEDKYNSWIGLIHVRTLSGTGGTIISD